MISSIAEFFTLRSAAAALAEEPAAQRAARTDVVRRARQKREAAEALWSVSQPVEALRLLVEAARLFRDALTDGDLATLRVAATTRTPAAEDAETPAADGATPEDDAATTHDDAAVKGPTPLAAPLRALGLSPASADEAAAVLAGLDALRIPALNRDTGGAEADAFRALSESLAAVDVALDPSVLTAGEITGHRVARGAWLLVALAALAGAAWYALRPGPDVVATASAVYAGDPIFGPDRVLDGDTVTEWLLPDRTPGTLELALRAPRRVTAVRLVNGHNREFNDRAVRDYEIELYAGQRLVKKLSGSFAQLVPAPAPVSIRADADGVDRVRIVVKSFHREGAALAEIALE
jgi:hypothetical protein